MLKLLNTKLLIAILAVLCVIASALHELGLSIALSKINTEGTKVADVFYVNELDPNGTSGTPTSPAIVSAAPAPPSNAVGRLQNSGCATISPKLRT